MLTTLTSRDPRAPAFMRNSAWADKTLTTALTSWAQLRHADILYGAQAYGGFGGGGPRPDPVGWVEPVPVFWRSYAALCTDFAASLRRLDLLTPASGGYLAKLGRQATDLAVAANVLEEAAGQVLIGCIRTSATSPHGRLRRHRPLPRVAR